MAGHFLHPVCGWNNHPLKQLSPSPQQNRASHTFGPIPMAASVSRKQTHRGIRRRSRFDVPASGGRWDEGNPEAQWRFCPDNRSHEREARFGHPNQSPCCQRHERRGAATANLWNSRRCSHPSDPINPHLSDSVSVVAIYWVPPGRTVSKLGLLQRALHRQGVGSGLHWANFWSQGQRPNRSSSRRGGCLACRWPANTCLETDWGPRRHECKVSELALIIAIDLGHFCDLAEHAAVPAG
jgi:hypothetical protein